MFKPEQLQHQQFAGMHKSLDRIARKLKLGFMAVDDDQGDVFYDDPGVVVIVVRNHGDGPRKWYWLYAHDMESGEELKDLRRVEDIRTMHDIERYLRWVMAETKGRQVA